MPSSRPRVVARDDLVTAVGVVDAQLSDQRIAIAVVVVADMGEPARVPAGSEHGPDLEEVARFAGCPDRVVIGMPAGTVYRVYM